MATKELSDYTFIRWTGYTAGLAPTIKGSDGVSIGDSFVDLDTDTIFRCSEILIPMWHEDKTSTLSYITATSAISLDYITVTSAINLDYITVTGAVDLDAIDVSVTDNTASSLLKAIAPATNTDLYVPQWDGDDSKTLKNGLAVGGNNGLLQLDANGKIPAVDGSQITGLTTTYSVTGPTGTTTTGSVPQWDAVTRVLKNGLLVGTGASNLVQLNGSAQLPAVDGSNLTGITVTNSAIAPATTTTDKVPQWDATNQTLKNGLVVGTGASNLVQLDTNSKLPAIDGSQLTNTVNNTDNVTISTATTVDKVPQWSTTGKILKDGLVVGVGASNLVQLNGSAQLPAVDGSLLTGLVVYGDLFGPAISTDNGVPLFDGTTGKSLKAGLNVGTSANNLIQLDGSVRLPAVDGSLLTNVSATGNFANADISGKGEKLTVDADDWLVLLDVSGAILKKVKATNITSGEVNTASNVGTGAGEIFKQKNVADLELKTILQGSGIVITNNVSDITISANHVQPLMFSGSDETTTITTGTTKTTFRMPYAYTLSSVRCSLSTASSSGVVQIDINKNGSTIFTTESTIDATEKTSETAVTPSVLLTTAFADDDEITLDIVGAGTGATGLKITMIGIPTY